MRAVDTNILLRIIVQDDPSQVPAAMRTLEEPALVGFGVLLEIAWVLHSTYGRPRGEIATTLAALLDVPTVHVPDAAGVRWAIERYRDHKADFADMLHIVAARGSSSFASFEKHLGRRAGPNSPLPIERPA
jgi:predicted nucleic-acid-binding protein